MSSADGLQKLTEYLNQTRRQAEAAIDVLNKRIFELQESNDEIKLEADRLRTERDYFFGLVEKLKQENSTKWRLQERDDWKALVESVQSDRARIQEMNNDLEAKLQQANMEIAKLNEQLGAKGGATSRSFSSPSKELEYTTSHTDQDGTPRTMSRNLKVELDKTRAQMEFDRKKLLTEKSAQDIEIKRLREALAVNQKQNNFPNGILGHGNTSGSGRRAWGAGLGGLLYLVWNGVSSSEDAPREKKAMKSTIIVI